MTFDLNPAVMGAGLLRGDARELARSLGSAAVLREIGRAAPDGSLEAVTDVASLRRFLVGYRDQVLATIEWPAITRAFHYAQRSELRELIQLDRQLRELPRLAPFATASQTIGRTYLRRLRPLRDQRLVRRYLQAVERGDAGGWHTLVFGVVLSVYSIPLRQGLLGYGLQTLSGFLDSGVRRLNLPTASVEPVTTELTAGLPLLLGRVFETGEPFQVLLPEPSPTEI